MHFRAGQEPLSSALQWIVLLKSHPAAEPSSLKVPQLHRGDRGSVTMVRSLLGIKAEVELHTWEQRRWGWQLSDTPRGAPGIFWRSSPTRPECISCCGL